MAVLNLIEEGRHGNETSFYVEKRKHRFAKKSLQRTTFWAWKDRFVGY